MTGILAPDEAFSYQGEAMAKKANPIDPIVSLAIFVAVGIGGVVAWWGNRRKAAAREAAEMDAQKRRKAILDARRSRIYATYPPDVAKRIDAGEYWEGMPANQLEDALGAPEDVDEKVLKTKKREIWKYKKTGENRYALRITLDNGVIAGWDQKE